MPQNENLNAEWRASLGGDWQRVHQEYLHTLGNLTLTGYNSEYSDRPFNEKRDMKGGFKESPLRLNKGLGSCEIWNEQAIKARADRLAGEAVGIWAMIELPSDVLDNYRPKKPATQTYTITDHPHLHDGITRELFEAFRAEVTALDECVTEEFLKLYIAYKAETNFVDVVPQAERLRLTINLDFPEIDDPLGLCKDVTDVGRWGNGNVEFCINHADDVKYAVGLVRQALEEQLGDDDAPE
jgi:predicted transport protein